MGKSVWETKQPIGYRDRLSLATQAQPVADNHVCGHNCVDAQYLEATGAIMKRFAATALMLFAIIEASLAPGLQATAADAASLPAGTRIYLTTDENVSSERGGDDVGTVVRCRVWRDVEAHGVVIIKSGTPANCRIDKVSRRNIGGFEGKVSIAGVETTSVDGQSVMLSGGYNKAGSGHKAVVWTVGLLLFWPALFVPGGNAELPPGTVFDVSTVNDIRIDSSSIAAAPRVVDLRSVVGGLSAEFMLDDFVNQAKHDTFRITVSKNNQLPSALFIDNVNGKSINPVPLTIKNITSKDGDTSGVAEVSAHTLSKYFVRGINRFEVSYIEDGQRKGTEVVINVQM